VFIKGGHGIFNPDFPNQQLFPPCVPKSSLSQADVEAWMVKPLPKAFVDLDDPDHHLSSPGYLFHWLETHPFYHPDLAVDPGGFDGACWGVLPIFRVMATTSELEKRPDLYPGVDPPLSTKLITRYMSHCAGKLIKHIRQSFTKLQPECHLWIEREGGGLEFKEPDVTLHPEPFAAVTPSLAGIGQSPTCSPKQMQQVKPQGKALSPTISVGDFSPS
jgi:hypothetical protein